MGKGFWILTWDSWGSGLNMVNPRMVEDGNGSNWHVYNMLHEKDRLIKELTKDLILFKILD